MYFTSILNFIYLQCYEKIKKQFEEYTEKHKLGEAFIEIINQCFENRAVNPQIFIANYLLRQLDLKVKEELEKEVVELKLEARRLELEIALKKNSLKKIQRSRATTKTKTRERTELQEIDLCSDSECTVKDTEASMSCDSD
jgi:hypothetical protein